VRYILRNNATPMVHSTSEKQSPRKECLEFLRHFARLYSPSQENEQEARKLAQALTFTSLPQC